MPGDVLDRFNDHRRVMDLCSEREHSLMLALNESTRLLQHSKNCPECMGETLCAVGTMINERRKALLETAEGRDA